MELNPDAANHNRGTERGTALLEDLLGRVGFGRPILIDKNKKIIAGNQITQAAINAGLIKLRIVKTRGNEVIAHMREDVEIDSKTGRELSIADNFSSQLNFDPNGAILQRQIEAYDIDPRDVGMSVQQLKALLRSATEEDDGTGSTAQNPKHSKEIFGVVVVCPDKDAEEAVLADLAGRYESGDMSTQGYRATTLAELPRVKQ